MKKIIDGGSITWKEKAELNYIVLSLMSEWDDTAQLIYESVLDEDHPFGEDIHQMYEQNK